MQVVTTKLFAPPHRTGLVVRPRLLERMAEGAQRKLTLLSAPAGFGKTTVVSEWIAATDRTAAWLTLDANDGDVTSFLAHVVAALRTMEPELAEGVQTALQTPQPVPTLWLLTELLNDVATLSHDVVLVLDDYHAVDAEAVDEALSYLIDHLPPRLHLVITTRQDPDLRLAKLRAQGQLTELRATDLRFTPAETAAFLNLTMGLELTAEDITLLEARTEGWIAGLQLAALSMRGRDDVTGFIASFAGDHRYVVDYLLEEVLKQQPERVRTFLLQTSILERLSGPLCDAVTASEGSDTLLHTLERANLFLVPLDDTRHWYRYHQLFRDVLRAHLTHEHSDQVARLHARASAWFEAAASPADAVRHALASGDFERAAGLIERQWRAMDSTFRSATWASWVEPLPDEVVRARPVLAVGYAWAQLNVGALVQADQHLRDVEAWLAARDRRDEEHEGHGRARAAVGDEPREQAAKPRPIKDKAVKPRPIKDEATGTRALAGDEQELRSLPGTLASARAYHALAVGDPATSVAYAQRALAVFSADDHVRRGIPLGILSLAHWANGDLDEARDMLADALNGFRAAGAVSASLSCTFGLADILVTQGRLRQATQAYQDAFRLIGPTADEVLPCASAGAPASVAVLPDAPPGAADLPRAEALPGAAELHVGLADIQREQGDLQAAEQHLRRAEELGERAVLTGDHARLRTVMARIEVGLGNLDRALALLDEADRLRVPNPMPDLQPVAAWRARVWLAQGRIAEATAWARDRGLTGEDPLSYMREFEHLVLARVLLARGRAEGSNDDLDQALSLLGRMLQAAEAGGRTGSVIEILALQALVLAAQGDERAAAATLNEALTLAEPEGYVRVFLSEGPAMTTLLKGARRQGAAAAYARQLLAAQRSRGSGAGARKLAANAPDARTAPAAGAGAGAGSDDRTVLEPLTAREAEVLRLLGTDQSGPEIARELRVSLNTFRTHVKNVYAKLGVNSRRAAVRQAKELDLL